MPKIENTIFLGGRIHLRAGDCLDRIRELPPSSIDSVVTDPPYALVSVVKRFGKAGSAPCIVPDGGSGAYARASAGYRHDDGRGPGAPASTVLGRWPANLIHDGSDEVISTFPNAPAQQRAVGPEHGAKSSVNVFGDYGPRDHFGPRGDSGSAARFFYNAKAGSDDRVGSKHPTVKPVSLLRYLVRLVTPPGGTVLDPFAGTGTTGEAAYREGFCALLMEREEEYRADIARRMALILASPDERKRAIAEIKAKPSDLAGTMFTLVEDEA